MSCLALTLMLAAGAPHAAAIEAALAAEAPKMPQDLRQTLTAVIAREAERHALDPALIIAIIRTESAFRTRAKSPAGALGLMQVLPRTARAFARRANVRWRGPRTLYDPVANVRIGTAYLAWLLDRFDDERTHALSGYCYGPGRIRRRIGAAAAAPLDTEYVRRVERALARIEPHFREPIAPPVVVADAAVRAVESTAGGELWDRYLFRRYISAVASTEDRHERLSLSLAIAHPPAS